MRVIGVIDLRGGLAVHARGGHRARYEPVRAVCSTAIPLGNAVAVAHAYASLGVEELYVAELDAIQARTAHGGSTLQEPPYSLTVDGHRHPNRLVAAIAAIGLPIWLDAGATSVDDAQQALGTCADRVVVGLETLTSFDALGNICTAVGRGRVTFSLDLRNGRPLGTAHDDNTPAVIASRAARSGIASIIVLDLARVGSGAGLDEALLADIRHAAPDVELLAGGGVRGPADLERLASLGYDGALVASALLSGTLTTTDIEAARRATLQG